MQQGRSTDVVDDILFHVLTTYQHLCITECPPIEEVSVIQEELEVTTEASSGEAREQTAAGQIY